MTIAHKTGDAATNVRPRLQRVSAGTQAFSLLLMEELRSWPGVTERPMFGFQAFYRDKAIFAALPKTRSVAHNAFMFKVPALTPSLVTRIEADPRIEAPEGERWINFELGTEEEIHDALAWLEIAYDRATAPPQKRKKNRGR